MLQQFFDHTGSVYWQARAPRILRSLAQRSAGRMLEIGCGTGLWTVALAQTSQHLIACDLDQAKVQQARQRSAEHSFVVASVEALPFTAASFDAVTCLDVIENVPNDSLAVAEMSRVLPPGGWLIVSILRRGRWSPFQQLHFSEYVREYSRAELAALLTSQPLVLISSFDFYRRWATLARELQMLLANMRWFGWLRPLRLVLWVLCVMLSRLDRFSHLPGGGLAMIVEKTSHE